MTEKEPSGDDRRTSMSIERTQLAWWRTALAALAVAIGIGRIVPQLNPSGTNWPYVVVGVGFAVYGIALFLQGVSRGRALGGPDSPRPTPLPMALAFAGPLLGLAVIVMIVAAG